MMAGYLDLALPLALVFLLAGTVKGLVGLGLPTTALALMTLMLDARVAIALVLLPMVAMNGWQVWRMGHIRRTLWRYLPFGLALMGAVWVTVLLSADVGDDLLLAILGGSILIFVAVNLTRFAPVIPDYADRPAQILAGLIAGVMGGLTSVWAPPLVLYLAARQTEKSEFVRASGLLILLGSLPLVAGYLAQGHLTGPVALMSGLLLAPSLLGFSLGERLRHRLSEQAFRRVLLAGFFLMGLNMIRRALL